MRYACRPSVRAALLLAAAFLPCTPLPAQEVEDETAVMAPPPPVADSPAASPNPDIGPAEAPAAAAAMAPIENVAPSGKEPDTKTTRPRNRHHRRGYGRRWSPPPAPTAAEPALTDVETAPAYWEATPTSPEVMPGASAPPPNPRTDSPPPARSDGWPGAGWIALIAAALAIAAIALLLVRRSQTETSRPIARMTARLRALATSERLSSETVRRSWSAGPTLAERACEAARDLRPAMHRLRARTLSDDPMLRTVPPLWLILATASAALAALFLMRELGAWAVLLIFAFWAALEVAHRLRLRRETIDPLENPDGYEAGRWSLSHPALKAPLWIRWPMRRMATVLSNQGAFFRPTQLKRLPGAEQLAAFVKGLRPHRVICRFALRRVDSSASYTQPPESEPTAAFDRRLLRPGYDLNWRWRLNVHFRPVRGVRPERNAARP